MDVPCLSSDGVETELIGDFWSCHGSWEILFVGINQDNGVLELFIVDHFVEFFLGIINSISIVRVDDENDTLGVGVVMPPELSDLILTTDIPHVEADILVLDSLDVESNGGGDLHGADRSGRTFGQPKGPPSENAYAANRSPIRR